MYDPELPRGFQDADFEIRELEASGRYHERMRKAGKCTHTWYQGPPKDAPIGSYVCFHCNAVLDSDPANDYEMREDAMMDRLLSEPFDQGIAEDC